MFGYRRWIIATLLFLMASACSREQKFDASTVQAFQRSLAEIKTHLSLVEQQHLERSLMTLALGDIVGTSGGNPFAALASMASMANPDAIVASLRPQIDGKSAAEVMELADAESLKRLQAQYDQLTADIKSEETELAQDREKAGAAKDILDNIVISRAKYYWNNNNFLSQPIIAFTIRNNTKLPIAAISVHGRLESPGRTIPWVDDDFSYQFAGGLELGETQNLELAPNMFEVWGNQDLKKLSDTILTLRVTNVEGPDKQWLIDVDQAAIDSKAMEVDTKRADLVKLQQQIATLKGGN